VDVSRPHIAKYLRVARSKLPDGRLLVMNDQQNEVGSTLRLGDPSTNRGRHTPDAAHNVLREIVGETANGGTYFLDEPTELIILDLGRQLFDKIANLGMEPLALDDD